MKKIASLALLAAVVAGAAVAVASGPPPGAGFAVREYAKNDDATDWMLQPGWTWQNGTLTHWPATSGPAQPAAMPPVTPGKTYRINVGFTGRTRGSVTVALGKTSYPGYGGDGGYTLCPVATDADARFTLTPTPDYDGSITRISVVELGDELIDKTGWTVPEGWSQHDGEFRHTPGAATTLWRAMNLVPGHSYQLTFNVNKAPDGPAGAGNGAVFLGFQRFGWFSHEGGWNFAFDFQAADDNRMAFVAQESPGAGAIFNGVIRNVSVREIVTDAPAPTPKP